MLLLYNLGVRFYFVLIWIASFFNKKAKLWIDGRKKADYQLLGVSAWFHFASLGEFEQGLPVVIAYRSSHPETKIVITFFSPSGYQIRKNTPYADAVYYLPLDTASNARKFIAAINPSIAVFTKYEYWYHFFYELDQRHIPLYIISGIFRPNQVFFRWYGSLYRKMLGYVTRFFVQDENSRQLLQNSGIDKVCVSGDTRFDRVWANARSPQSFPVIEAFAAGHRVLVAGSTWPQDEEILAKLISGHPNWKFIIAPHEIRQENIERLIQLLPPDSAARHSRPGSENALQTIIIDNIGMLSGLYQYGQIAYIGGGFGAGIHNTLEAAAFGLPVIFGPNFEKFREASELLTLGLGFSVKGANELQSAFTWLSEDEIRRRDISKKIENYVGGHTGATQMIMAYLINP